MAPVVPLPIEAGQIPTPQGFLDIGWTDSALRDDHDLSPGIEGRLVNISLRPLEGGSSRIAVDGEDVEADREVADEVEVTLDLDLAIGIVDVVTGIDQGPRLGQGMKGADFVQSILKPAELPAHAVVGMACSVKSEQDPVD